MNGCPLPSGTPGEFRRRPAKRGRAGFARSREDITALGGSFGDTYRSQSSFRKAITRMTLLSCNVLLLQTKRAVREIQDQMIHEAVRKAGVGDEQLVLA